jgi:hypothetical protein
MDTDGGDLTREGNLSQKWRDPGACCALYGVPGSKFVGGLNQDRGWNLSQFKRISQPGSNSSPLNFDLAYPL